ncbi:MAG: hypothetical protein ABIJ42_01705, partial [Acidobacteriota bacterium]
MPSEINCDEVANLQSWPTGPVRGGPQGRLYQPRVEHRRARAQPTAKSGVTLGNGASASPWRA